MKQTHGWWLPAGDTYFAGEFEKQGRVGFQDERLLAALEWQREFDCAFDIGAHTGIWSAQLAKRFKFVAAFEPDPETFACLERNLPECPEIRLHNVALADREGTCEMDPSYSPGNTGGHFIRQGEGAIPVKRLAEYRGILPDPDFVKIDVEGAEALVLQGGREWLQSVKPNIYVEMKKGFGSRFGVEDRAAYSLLVEMGARPIARWRADHLFSWR